MKETYLVASKITHSPPRIIRNIDDDWVETLEGDEFLVGVSLTIHGETFSEDDDEDYHYKMEELIQADKAPLLCKMSGYLVLAEEAIRAEHNPLIVCDNYDGDLSYMYTILDQSGLASDHKKGYERNIFYIHEMEWSDSIDVFTKNRIIKQLKGFIFELYHVCIDVVCYYLAPVKPYERPSYLTREKELMLQNKMANIFSNKEESNIVQLGDHIDYSEGVLEYDESEDIDSPYPKEFVNKVEYNEFKAIGFTEIDESRLMVKLT